MKRMKKERIVPANPVELMAGWEDFLQAMFIVAWGFGTLALWQSGDSDSVIVDAIVIGLILGVVWSPGLVVLAIFPGAKNRLALLSSTYDSAESIFAGGVRQAWRRCLCLPLGSASGICVVLALFLSTAIIIGSLGSVFNPDAWLLSLVTGALLSLGGTIVIGMRLLCDFCREARLRRQVF